MNSRDREQVDSPTVKRRKLALDTVSDYPSGDDWESLFKWFRSSLNNLMRVADEMEKKISVKRSAEVQTRTPSLSPRREITNTARKVSPKNVDALTKCGRDAMENSDRIEKEVAVTRRKLKINSQSITATLGTETYSADDYELNDSITNYLFFTEPQRTKIPVVKLAEPKTKLTTSRIWSSSESLGIDDALQAIITRINDSDSASGGDQQHPQQNTTGICDLDIARNAAETKSVHPTREKTVLTLEDISIREARVNAGLHYSPTLLASEVNRSRENSEHIVNNTGSGTIYGGSMSIMTESDNSQSSTGSEIEMMVQSPPQIIPDSFDDEIITGTSSVPSVECKTAETRDLARKSQESESSPTGYNWNKADNGVSESRGSNIGKNTIESASRNIAAPLIASRTTKHRRRGMYENAKKLDFKKSSVIGPSTSKLERGVPKITSDVTCENRRTRKFGTDQWVIDFRKLGR